MYSRMSPNSVQSSCPLLIAVLVVLSSACGFTVKQKHTRIHTHTHKGKQIWFPLKDPLNCPSSCTVWFGLVLALEKLRPGRPCSHPRSIKGNYNPVAPRDIPELWPMHGISCMVLGKSWLTTRPFSPLLVPAADARGRVDVLMASLIDCCGIKQKPF